MAKSSGDDWFVVQGQSSSGAPTRSSIDQPPADLSPWRAGPWNFDTTKLVSSKVQRAKSRPGDIFRLANDPRSLIPKPIDNVDWSSLQVLIGSSTIAMFGVLLVVIFFARW